MSFLEQERDWGARKRRSADTPSRIASTARQRRDDMPLCPVPAARWRWTSARSGAAQMDSSIITEAAPVRTGRLRRTRPAAPRPEPKSADRAAAGIGRPGRQQQRILGGLVLLGVIGRDRHRPSRAERGEQGRSAQVGATGQALMQSQRLAKSVSQALVGSHGRPSRRCGKRRRAGAHRARPQDRRGTCAGGGAVGREDCWTSGCRWSTAPRRTPATVVSQQKILTQVGQALRTINRQSSDLLEIAETCPR